MSSNQRLASRRRCREATRHEERKHCPAHHSILPSGGRTAATCLGRPWPGCLRRYRKTGQGARHDGRRDHRTHAIPAKKGVHSGLAVAHIVSKVRWACRWPERPRREVSPAPHPTTRASLTNLPTPAMPSVAKQPAACCCHGRHGNLGPKLLLLPPKEGRQTATTTGASSANNGARGRGCAPIELAKASRMRQPPRNLHHRKLGMWLESVAGATGRQTPGVGASHPWSSHGSKHLPLTTASRESNSHRLPCAGWATFGASLCSDRTRLPTLVPSGASTAPERRLSACYPSGAQAAPGRRPRAMRSREWHASGA